MATTTSDIARAASVGESTVGRALHGKGYVSPATRERILKAAAELNYQPNHIARSLVLGKTDFVGIVASDATMFDLCVGPIEKGIREAGYSMSFYASTSARPESEEDIFREMIGRRVEGAIIIPASLTSDAEPYNLLLRNGVKIVIVDKNIPGVRTPQIVFDHYGSARLATEHLISLGHENIVYLAIPQTSYVGRERGKGFRDALNAAGIPISKSSVIETGHTEEAGFQAGIELFKCDNRPTAILARHDIVAVGIIQAAMEVGLSVPRDVSIVGHGDIPLAHALRVPLTTIHNPNKEMTTRAVEMLLEMLSGKPVTPSINTLGTHLVVRSSTAPPGAH